MTAFIDDHRDEYGVEPICRVLPIAASTYHERVAQRRDPSRLSPRAQRDEAMKPEVRRVFDANFEVYGVRKVWRQMQREGFDIALSIGHRLSECFDLSGAQASRALPACQLFRAFCGVFCQQAFMLGMTEDRVESADASCSNAGTAGGLAAATAASLPSGSSIEHIGLHRLNVSNRQLAGNPLAEKRLDVCPDPDFIHVERRGLDRPVPAPEDAALSRFGELPIAQFGNVHLVARAGHRLQDLLRRQRPQA